MSKEIAKIMSKVILAERTIRIKLLGDSITHGVGGTGFEQNGEAIVEGFARNKDGYCWAKLFKEHMERQYDCIVTNNACTGTTTEFVIENFEQLVDVDDDIVICTIGTNNRHQYFSDAPKHTKREHMEIFYENIIKLYDKFKEVGKDVIFVANIPTAAENEKDGEDFWRIFHMNDVNDLYMKASTVCGFPLISMYWSFLEYCELKGITVDSLLADGLHPNDNGYDVMFRLMLKELGIGQKLSETSTKR